MKACVLVRVGLQLTDVPVLLGISCECGYLEVPLSLLAECETFSAGLLYMCEAWQSLFSLRSGLLLALGPFPKLVCVAHTCFRLWFPSPLRSFIEKRSLLACSVPSLRLFGLRLDLGSLYRFPQSLAFGFTFHCVQASPSVRLLSVPSSKPHGYAI